MVREQAGSEGHETRHASSPVSSHRVVVVGGGFGGLQAVKALHGAPVEVTLVDRNNYFHLFQPLTYQVAAGALWPDEIAKPLRTIFRRAYNVRVLMAEVTSFDLENRTVFNRPVPPGLGPQTIPYDTLVVVTRDPHHRSPRLDAVARRPPDLPDRLRGPLVVLVRWVYNFLTHGRGARSITHLTSLDPPKARRAAEAVQETLASGSPTARSRI